tara:strand:+ start:436 stop:1347 length:912 start_codon:yes stop_codon:yes gene_type:complete
MRNIITKIINRYLKLILNPKLSWIFISYEFKKIFYDIFFIFKKKYKYKIIFLAGMPMSATTKVKNMCGMIPGYFTRYSPMPYNIRVNQDISNSAFRYTPFWSYTLFKTHLNPNSQNLDIIKKNGVEKVIVTYRDLRDVVIARYHRLIKFPKKKNDPNFSEYHLIKKSDAINDSIEVVSKDYINWINGWFDIANSENNFVLFIKFEDLIINPKNEFKKILNFYEINLNEKFIEQICKNTEGKKDMVTNLNESRILPWALSSNFRSGKIGNWKSEFTEENLIYAKKLLSESLIKLKYEFNSDWTL